MSNTLQDALEAASLDLFQSYKKSLSLAMESWLPAIGVKNDSQNGYPHVKNIEMHLNSILLSDENRRIHNFELSAIELYVLLMSVLLHDIGKYEEMALSGTPGEKHKHSHHSYEIISDKWAELGIVSKQIADMIALISYAHDYKKDATKAKDVEKRLNNYMKTEHNGIVRAKALASLLFLGDHMDGSLSRAVPQLGKAKQGIVGQFRSEVQSVYFDLKNKMLCTSINARLLAAVNTRKDIADNNVEDDTDDARFFSESDYRELKNVQKDINEKEGLPVPILDEDEYYCRFLVGLIDEENEKNHTYQCKIINTLIRDVEKNNSEIELVRKSLYEIGMPVLGWFLECNGLLFSVEKNKKDKNFQHFKIVRAHEPILTEGFLKTIFRGMVEISGSSLGDNYYDYKTLLNYSREPSSNMHKIKCAVNRLEILHNNFCLEKDNPVVFYCDANFWSLKIRGKNVKEQRRLLKQAYEKIFAVKPEEPAQSELKSEEDDKESDKLNVCEKITYDIENSVVFSNPLDYLLCRDLQHHSHQAGESLKISKYQIAKLLGKNCESRNCNTECDECKYLATKRGEKENIHYLGGMLLSNEKKTFGLENFDIKRMLGEERFEPGAGNIVITGSCGTGKSTMSFQMASACANKINQGISVYYSLESTRHDTVENYIIKRRSVEKKINYFEWYPGSENDDKKDSDSLGRRLKTALLVDKKGRILPQMVFPKLTPKNIVDTSSPEFNKSGLFEKRFQEIKYMLSAIDAYNNTLREEKDARVKMVVIDSLNAFADRPLLRGEVHRLFDLFTTYHMLGIFAMEESAQEDFVGANYNDSIQYRADGVILLRSSNFQSHHESYLEIRKMRNQQHVLGEQLYKIRSQEYDPHIGNIMNREIEIYPSLHYLISATERLEETSGLMPYEGALPLTEDCEKNNIFHIKDFNYILPESIINRNRKTKDETHRIPSSQVITITGRSGFYKSDLVINALFAGMVFENENGLLIRLSDRDLFEEDGVRISKELFDSFPPGLTADVDSQLKVFELYRFKDNEDIGLNTAVYKTRTKTWRINNETNNTLTELIFTSGALKPEEFIDTVLRVIQLKNIKRVALIDLKTIGISYPFLINSETSGTMFIPAFVHLMRNHKIHLIISTSISHVEDSASEINKACELSDALITITPSETPQIKTLVESSGNKVRKEKYSIEQEEDQYYCCRINQPDGDPDPSYTPKLKPFVIGRSEV